MYLRINNKKLEIKEMLTFTDKIKSLRFNLYKIDLDNKSKPIQEYKTIRRVDMTSYAYSLFDRMVFIGDKYYLLSFDKVYIYQLTGDELKEVGIKELTTK